MYSPNNIYVYMQAFSGAVAGLLGQSNSLTSTRGATTPTIGIAGAWAQEVDTQWASSTNPDLFEYEEILSFSTALFLVCDPQPEPESTTAATYTTSAKALIAILADTETYLSGQGIVVPPIPGGGGGGVEGFTYVSASATVAADASNIVVLASAGTVRFVLPALASLPDNWTVRVSAQGCTMPIVVVPPTGTIWDPSTGIFNGTATLPNGSGGSIAAWQFDKTNSRFVEVQ